MANTYLTRTVASTGDRTKATFSAWVKKSDTSSEQFLFYNYESGTTNFRIRFNPEVLQVETLSGSSVVGTLTTNRKFRDPSGFYHILVAIDSTSGTADDRMKIYVNGVQETSFSARTNPPQNQNMAFNESSHVQYVGSQVTANYFNGIMSHYYWIDGTAYTPSTFGSTDSVTGEWKINTSPSITMGTNGFTILKDGNTITDQSSNSNNFTLGGGTLTNTEDCPSNVFCVINPADRFNGNNTNTPDNLQNGATKMVTSNASFLSTRGSIGVTSGKWYWEAKQGAGTAWAIGICNNAMVSQTSAQFWDNTTITGVAINGSGGTAYVNGGNGDSWNEGTSVNSNTIYGFALDMDNRAFYISINGTYLTANGNVGDPTSGSSRTGSVLGELTTRGGTGGLNYIPQGELIYPFQGDVSSGNSCAIEMNFGNGYFGTTAISSEGTNASGIGKFEYDVPTGYTALSTKGLNE